MIQLMRHAHFSVQHYLVVATQNRSNYYVHIEVCLHYVAISETLHITFSFFTLKSDVPCFVALSSIEI